MTDSDLSYGIDYKYYRTIDIFTITLGDYEPIRPPLNPKRYKGDYSSTVLGDVEHTIYFDDDGRVMQINIYEAKDTLPTVKKEPQAVPETTNEIKMEPGDKINMSLFWDIEGLRETYESVELTENVLLGYFADKPGKISTIMIGDMNSTYPYALKDSDAEEGEGDDKEEEEDDNDLEMITRDVKVV